MESIVVEKVAEYGLTALLVFMAFRYFISALERKDAQNERIAKEFAEQVGEITERFAQEVRDSRRVMNDAGTELALIRQALANSGIVVVGKKDRNAD